MSRWHRVFQIQLLKLKVDHLLAHGDGCQWCGNIGSVLHHKIALETARTPDEARFLALDPKNVVWICTDCYLNHHQAEYAKRRRDRELAGPAAEFVPLVEELLHCLLYTSDAADE